MTSPIDNSGTPVSLDSAFSPVSRQQWVDMAIAGLGSDNNDALQALRRTTLEGIPLEVLYDSMDTVTPSLGERSSSALDNRLCVRTSDADLASNNIFQGLQGGIHSIELHAQSPDYIATALSGVKLDLAPVSLRANHDYEQCTQALLALADTQDLENGECIFTLNVDPVSNALAKGTGDAQMFNELARMASFTSSTAAQLTSSKCVLVDTALHHNAGASTVEELHAALATATLYLEALLDNGMSPRPASEQIVFQIALDADILLGVAKIRALRALWQVVLAHFDTDNTLPHHTHIVAESSQRFLSKRQPWNNHLRNLCAGTAAMLGGADTLMVHPHDVLHRADASADTTLGERMARNMPIILERECGLGHVQDPMAGSYAIENLTRQLMQHAWQSLSSTDTGEGWVSELLSGRWQTRLTNTHKQRITLMQQEQRIAVGVNRFVQADELFNATSDQPEGLSTNAFSSSSALKAVRESQIFETAALSEISS